MTGSVGLTPKSILRRTRVSAKAPAKPNNRPTARNTGSRKKQSDLGWQKKLKPGAVQFLRLISENFESAWEFYRQTLNRDEIESANINDLDWKEYYRVIHPDRELFDVFLDRDRFVQFMQEVQKHVEADREEFFLNGVAFKTRGSVFSERA